MEVEPCLYSGNGWSGSFLASGKTLFRAEALDLGFDGIELADEPHTLFCNQGSAIGAVPARVISTSLRRAWAQQ